jgi:hypothetical protein
MQMTISAEMRLGEVGVRIDYFDHPPGDHLRAFGR